MNKLNRRHFLTATTTTGLASLATFQATAAQEGGSREFYELRQYLLETKDQKEGLDRFLKEAALPALHRLGIGPVGVFTMREAISPVYVLLPHPSLASVATLTERLAADGEFLDRGAPFIDAPAESPAYQRMESSLLAAFAGMPRLERPVRNPGRILQLRIYESPSVSTGLKKIEMFNDAGEIAIFREVGLHPVFFGQTLVGAKMPNLTYMLAFESEEELKANWRKFGQHPDWRRLRAMPEYADKKILSNITNILLEPTDYSEI